MCTHGLTKQAVASHFLVLSPPQLTARSLRLRLNDGDATVMVAATAGSVVTVRIGMMNQQLIFAAYRIVACWKFERESECLTLTFANYAT